MRTLIILLLSLLPFPACAQAADPGRAQIAQWLQDGAWDEVIAVAAAAALPDAYLLGAAGYAAYQAGDKATSAGYFERLLATDSNSVQGLYYSALILKSDERSREAIPVLERLCQVVPDRAQYAVLLGDCYVANGRKTDAVRVFRTARILSPGSAIIANKLAGAWIKTGQTDSAALLLEAAMSAHPRDPALISTAIGLAYSRKQYAQSAALCDSLIATGKIRYEPMITGIYADIALPDYRHAVRLGNLLLALGTDPEEVLYYTALAHQHLRHWAEADTLLRRCVAKVLKPNLEAYYLALAGGAAQLGQAARSQACYDTAFYLFKNPQTLYRSGLALEQSGRKAAATRVYKRYLALPAARRDAAISRYMEQVVAH